MGIDNHCIACGNKKLFSIDIRDKKQLRGVEQNPFITQKLFEMAIQAIGQLNLHDFKFIAELKKI